MRKDKIDSRLRKEEQMEKEKKKSIGIPNVRMGRRGRAIKETKKKKLENSQISQHPRKKNISALSRWRAVSRRYAGQKLEDEAESKELFQDKKFRVFKC